MPNLKLIDSNISRNNFGGEVEHKYKLLVKVLDKLCEEAPKSYKTYYPNSNQPEAVDKARSLAFIHLLLKVKFGIIDFLERHKLITEGTNIVDKIL